MKKSITALLSLLSIFGTASCLAQPFEPVPAEHWSAAAISELSSKGIISKDDYALWQKEQPASRFETAQLLAKALAQTPAAEDQPAMTQLLKEYKEELKLLGLRTAKLKKGTDRVIWKGKLSSTYTAKNIDLFGIPVQKTERSLMQLKLSPVIKINNHWQAGTVLSSSISLNNDKTVSKEKNTDNEILLRQLYFQGKYPDFTIKFGKQSFTDKITGQNGNLLFSSDFTGASLAFGNKLKTTIFGGRTTGYGDADYDEDTDYDEEDTFDDPAGLFGLDLQYTAGKLSATTSYYHLQTNGFKGSNFYMYSDDYAETFADITAAGLSYQFDKNSTLKGGFAVNPRADHQNSAWQLEYDYKGAKAKEKGSWGIWAGYRMLGGNTALMASEKTMFRYCRGWNIGANYTLQKNILLSANYFRGSFIEDPQEDPISGKAEQFYAKIDFLF